MTQEEGKKFFINKALAQARVDGVALSEAEKYLLGWSEDKVHDVTDTRMHAQFTDETTDEAFETKISKLLKKAYANDLRLGHNAGATYKAAYAALSKGDHYIGVMAETAFFDELNIEEVEPVDKVKDQAVLLGIGSSFLLIFPMYFFLKKMPIFFALGGEGEHLAKAFSFILWGHIPAIYFAHKKIVRGYLDLIVTSAIFIGAYSLLITVFSYKLINWFGEDGFGEVVGVVYFACLFIIFARRSCYTFLKLHFFSTSRSTNQ